MNENNKYRKAKVAKLDTGSDLVSGVDVIIEVKGTCPILGGDYIDALTGPNGADLGLDTTITTTVDAIGTIANVLYSDNGSGDNRFTFLGKAKSAISMLTLDFYYDEEYKDIIAIPELKLLGTGANESFYSGREVVLQAYSIGYGVSNKQPIEEFLVPLNPEDKSGIPKPNRFTQTKTMLAPIYGLEKNSLYTGNARRQEIITNYSKRGAPVQLVELELNTTLFASNIKIPTYNLLHQYHGQMRLDYVGNKAITKIVLPLQF